jgi:polyisoprenoid-binding protein YceI
MKREFFLKALAVTSIVFCSYITVKADTYTIDPDHSVIGFKVKHLAISNVAGKFGEFNGTFQYDPKNIATSKTEAVIKVSSVDTQNKKRDDHLKEGDFFDEKKFPEIKFVSKEVKNVKGDTFDLVGDLTMHGMTKTLTLPVTFGGVAKDMYGNDRAAFSATTKLNRKDFGLAWSKLLETGALVVGDEVTINLEVEGIKKAKA